MPTGEGVAVVSRTDPAQGLAAKVAFLRRPDSYPEPTTKVEPIEAHLSWIFLTDRHAYKLKKPIRHNGIDYRTPALRRLNCRRELRLNRRLAEDVYLEVVAMTAGSDGELALGNGGRKVDWLVRMRRLPGVLTLESRLQAGEVTAADARSIIARLAPFFAAAPRVPVTAAGYRRRLFRAIVEADATLRRVEYGLSATTIARLTGALRAFVGAQGTLLDARARAARVVEGHGDLRPEHIYLTRPPAILDCIEFDRRLRQRDPAEELAFMAMECDRAACPQFDRWLFTAYRELGADAPPRALIEFYKAYSAIMRARIAILHIDDPDTGPRQHWVDRADDYLAYCARYLDRI